jgi:hypothetical protein
MKKLNNIMKRGIFTILVLVLLISPVLAARYETPNFIINAKDPIQAKQYGDAAEHFRKELAMAYFGKEMPTWGDRCPININTNKDLGAGGATTFVFNHGEVFGWKMDIQGSHERLLDSVIPHEVMHMITASFLRQPLSRWADEGVSTSIEHVSERQNHRKMLIEFLHNKRGIPFTNLFSMKEYPSDIMPLYAQGFSLTEFLIDIGGTKKFGEFLMDWKKYKGAAYNDVEAWKMALKENYGTANLAKLQNTWLNWVENGFPNICTEGETV